MKIFEDKNEYKKDDGPNIQKLKERGLPIIENLYSFFDALELNDSQISLIFGYENRKKYLYKTKIIEKRNGKNRILHIPNDNLKSIQKAVNKVVLSKFPVSQYATGYIKGKSICDNASPHVNAKTLLKFDIEDFFPSIDFSKVYEKFRLVGYGKQVSLALTNICLGPDDCLPQGAPTSPTLSNIVCYRLDARLGEFCKKNHYNYTRYSDDITISSNNKLSKKEINKIKFIVSIIVQGKYGNKKFAGGERFTLNDKKFRIIFNGNRFIVTGLITNDVLSIPKSKLREIDNFIRCSNKYGLLSYLENINEKNIDKYLNHIHGMILYYKMVNPIKGDNYLRNFKLITSLYNQEVYNHEF